MNIEQFVNDYLQEHRHDVLLNPHNGLVEFAEALKAEELKEAVEGEVVKDHLVTQDPRYFYASINVNLPEGVSEGDKVRFIIVKED